MIDTLQNSQWVCGNRIRGYCAQIVCRNALKYLMRESIGGGKGDLKRGSIGHAGTENV